MADIVRICAYNQGGLPIQKPVIVSVGLDRSIWSKPCQLLLSYCHLISALTPTIKQAGEALGNQATDCLGDWSIPGLLYGGPGGRAMRRCLCANVDVMVDDVDVMVDNVDVTIDNG